MNAIPTRRPARLPQSTMASHRSVMSSPTTDAMHGCELPAG